MSKWSKALFKSERTFIVPNTVGLLLGLIFFVCLFTGALFNRPVLQLFGLTIAILYLSGMVQTNSNLNEIQIRAKLDTLGPEGSITRIPITLINPGDAPKVSLNLAFETNRLQGTIWIPVIMPGEELNLELPLNPLRRGKHRMPRIRIWSEFPVGLFHAWRYQSLNTLFWAHPRPAASETLPEKTLLKNEGDLEYQEHRPALNQDPSRWIDWKRLAKTGQKLSKVYGNEGLNHFHFSWSDTQHLNPEERLSRFTRWILDAERSGFPWSADAPFREQAVELASDRVSGYLKAMAEYEETPS
jgi:uncharacterized protein (DUF58 family)